MLVRISLAGVRPIGRNTQGVRLINVKKNDRVIGMELVESVSETPETEPDQE
jgi:DNA gyrase/topoisomerase IV subunit A